jgi:hypothetical protein
MHNSRWLAWILPLAGLYYTLLLAVSEVMFRGGVPYITAAVVLLTAGLFHLWRSRLRKALRQSAPLVAGMEGDTVLPVLLELATIKDPAVHRPAREALKRCADKISDETAHLITFRQAKLWALMREKDEDLVVACARILACAGDRSSAYALKAVLHRLQRSSTTGSRTLQELEDALEAIRLRVHARDTGRMLLRAALQPKGGLLVRPAADVSCDEQMLLRSTTAADALQTAEEQILLERK